jgi:hypothetical protein
VIRRIGIHVALATIALGAMMTAGAAPTPLEFQRALTTLHEQQLARQPVRTTIVAGKYEGSAAARYRYEETSYFEAASGRLLSRVRRDAVKPHAIHVIEVNVHDEAGRVIRDYVSIAQPWAPLQPGRSLINLHQYHGQLHSFRQFDLANRVGYESCTGLFEGRPVRIGLDDDEITPQATATPEYQACFDGLDKDAGKYLTPF